MIILPKIYSFLRVVLGTIDLLETDSRDVQVKVNPKTGLEKQDVL
jgi:hypothetical protein